ncbi:DUF6890 family protein [Victivallis vadensis]|nr:hypothetical protein [Victivallis vadensis]
MLTVYARKHFPGRPLDTECLADAAFIEWDYWEKFSTILKNLLGG